MNLVFAKHGIKENRQKKPTTVCNARFRDDIFFFKKICFGRENALVQMMSRPKQIKCSFGVHFRLIYSIKNIGNDRKGFKLRTLSRRKETSKMWKHFSFDVILLATK